MKRIGGALAALLGGLLLWGLIAPRVAYDVEREAASTPGLPDAWEGTRIAVLADLQIGMWLDNPGMVETIVARTVEEDPAAVLLAGDFVFHVQDDLDPALDRVSSLLRPLTDAGLPTYAVLGNHDWGMLLSDSPPEPQQARRVEASLERIGIEVLSNESATLTGEPGSPPLYVVGLGPHHPKQDRPREALAGVPEGAPRIVLMHNPASFPEIPASAAPLAVAGHTHGGQVRIAGFPHWAWHEWFQKGEMYADGWIEASYGSPGNRLYVNRGIGFSFFPLRINCQPELTLFELR